MQKEAKKTNNIRPLDTSRLERIPPYNLEAEESLLGSMLLSRDAIVSTVTMIRTEDFYRRANQEVYKAIVELYANGEPVDTITVGDHLKKSGHLEQIGGNTFLHSLINNTTIAFPGP